MVCREVLQEPLRIYRKLTKDVDDYERTSFSRALRCEARFPLRMLDYGAASKTDHPVIKGFLTLRKEAYIIPLWDPYAIRGFEIRAVEGKDFRLVSDGGSVFYGFHRYKDFKYGQVSFLVEGIKDATAIAEQYPYVIAMLGVSIGQDTAQVLRKLTDRWVYIPDSDYWGRKVESRVSRSLQAEVYKFPLGKDLGELWEGNEDVRDFIKTVVGLSCGGG